MKTLSELQSEVDAKIKAGILPKGAEVSVCADPTHCPHWTHRQAVDVAVEPSLPSERTSVKGRE